MPIVIAPESETGKELAKWNTPKRDGGYGADGFEPYPRMLYKARLKEGRAVCLEAPPDPYTFKTQPEYDRAVHQTEQANRRGTRIVANESEERLAVGQGWYLSQEAALEGLEHEQQAIGNAAAERAFTDQRMSERARAEAKAADDATHEHVAEVKAPKKRPYRKRVIATVTGG